MNDWLAIGALAISAVGALVGLLGFLQSKRSSDRKRADLRDGQFYLLLDHTFVLQQQLHDAGIQPKPMPDGIFPKE